LNSRKTKVFKHGVFVERQWRQVQVGDIVMVNKDTEFPADLLLIAGDGGKDIVYVDTMNLDGETNLKEKYVFSKEMNAEKLRGFRGEVVCDSPNESLEDWDGNIHFDGKVLNCR
jgi:P-type E1-E2 ATPase